MRCGGDLGGTNLSVGLEGLLGELGTDLDALSAIGVGRLAREPVALAHR